MATELGKAYVQIVPSALGISGKISKELNGEISRAGDQAGQSLGSRIGSVAKKAIAAAGIGTAVNQSITQGARLEQSIGGIETLFKESSDAVREYARNSYKTAQTSANS